MYLSAASCNGLPTAEYYEAMRSDEAMRLCLSRICSIVRGMNVRVLRTIDRAYSRKLRISSSALVSLAEIMRVYQSSPRLKLTTTPPEPSSGEEPGQETVVPEGGIKPGMEPKIFESKKHGFRLHVQAESVPAHPAEEQTSGPITVALLPDTLTLEDEQLEGVLEVHCLPSKRRFDAPLLFDFLVKGGNKDDPIIDQHGRIRYEVK